MNTTAVVAAALIVVSCVTVVAKTPCVTKAELRIALKKAAHEIVIKGGWANQRTWRLQAYQIVLKQYQDYRVCDGDDMGRIRRGL